MKIKIQLIPKTCYGKNLRSVLPSHKWQQLSRLVRSNSNGVCEICGMQVSSISEMDAHEVWAFEKRKNKKGKIKYVQRLVKIQASCKLCHKAAHIGHSSYGDDYERVVDHYLCVNGCKYSKFVKKQRRAYQKFLKRSEHKWKLDINKRYIEKLMQEKLDI